jgi:hypothetical protein
MHLKNKRPVLVPVQFWPEIEKLSKATLMDIAWDLAQRCSGDDGLNGPRILQELRDTAEIVKHYQK